MSRKALSLKANRDPLAKRGFGYFYLVLDIFKWSIPSQVLSSRAALGDQDGGQFSTWHEERSGHLGRREVELHLIPKLLAVEPSKLLFTEVLDP